MTAKMVRFNFSFSLMYLCTLL